MRNTYFTSPATGRDYYIDTEGLAQEIQPEYIGCECEQDWNCPHHGGTDRPTWIETRFMGLEDDEERYYVRP
jgi:hypothetical protein